MESGGIAFDSVGHGAQLTDSNFSRSHGNGSNGVQFSNSKSNYVDGKELARNGSIAQGNLEAAADDVCHELILLICLLERCCSSYPIFVHQLVKISTFINEYQLFTTSAVPSIRLPHYNKE